MDRRLIRHLKPTVPSGVRFEDLGDRLVLRAEVDLSGVATGVFASPAVCVELEVAPSGGVVDFVGFSFAQFAMPVRGGTGRPIDWSPASNVNSPHSTIPVVLRSGSDVCLLAPLDSWHEQIIAVDQDLGGEPLLRWGWHGDLDEVPAGTVTTLGIFEGSSVEACFDAWGRLLREQNPVDRPGADHPLRRWLSYWTDNGAAYWYRREPDLTIGDSIATKIDELDELGVTIGAVELDSWFYPHEITRPVVAIDAADAELDQVPPTGMLEWQPRPDVLPDGIEHLAARLGDRPLVLHSRHIATTSPYVDDGEWWSELVAHPVDNGFFHRWFEDARRWGAVCLEQDWMVVTWFCVRELRAAPARAQQWLAALNDAAAAVDMVVIWCMATPADMIAAVGLDRVVAVRSGDDYRIEDDPARLWRWYLTVNRLAGALGVPVFKDCFFTASEPGSSGFDGDRHAEAESVLAGLSGGVVGIGDRIGCTDVSVVRRLCLPDGSIATTDTPLALTDASFFDSEAVPLVTWAEAHIGPWRYVVALHLAEVDETVPGRFELGDRYLVYDWRSGGATESSEIVTSLPPRGWALYVCCPIEVGRDGDRRALIGDPTRYATMAGIDPRAAPQPDGSAIMAWSSDEGLHELRFSDP